MNTEILNPGEIDQGVSALIKGDVIAIPTETVYGLAGLTFLEDSLLKIFNAKERPLFDPLITHVSKKILLGDALENLAEMNLIDLDRIPSSLRTPLKKLMAAFWPGPLTLILPKSKKVPDLATAGLPHLGIRVPNHPLTEQLLCKLSENLPKNIPAALSAPSANRFGRISPTNAQDVNKELAGRIPCILDGGPCRVGLESTVLALNEKNLQYELLRHGGTPVESLEKALGQKILMHTDFSKPKQGMKAPGLLESHYAPQKPLVLVTDILENPEAWQKTFPSKNKPGFLGFSDKKIPFPGPKEFLTRTSDLKEAAKNLFAKLRKLDESDCDYIVAEQPKSELGLALAIKDRLTRASKPPH